MDRTLFVEIYGPEGAKWGFVTQTAPDMRRVLADKLAPDVIDEIIAWLERQAEDPAKFPNVVHFRHDYSRK